MVGDIFEQILPLLGVKKDYKNQIDKELRRYIDASYHDVLNFIKFDIKYLKWFYVIAL